MTLVCKAAGGNPLAEISWYKNGIKVDSSYTTSGRDSSNTYSFMASSEDNNAKYRCESQNELSSEPLMAEIVLSVNCKFLIRLFKGNSDENSLLLLYEEVSFFSSFGLKVRGPFQILFGSNHVQGSLSLSKVEIGVKTVDSMMLQNYSLAEKLASGRGS